MRKELNKTMSYSGKVKRALQMKRVVFCVVFFLFGTTIFGCAYGTYADDPDIVMLQENLNRITSENQRIGEQMELALDSAEAIKGQLKEGMELWDRDLKAYKADETALVNGLTNGQLEIYSAYEESLNDGSGIAKKVLSLRKLTTTLTDGQKAELVRFGETARSLEERKQELLRKSEELNRIELFCLELFKQLDQVDAERVRNLNYIRQQLGQAMIERDRTFYTEIRNAQKSLQRTSDIMRTNLQHQVMTNALRDITDAIRDY